MWYLRYSFDLAWRVVVTITVMTSVCRRERKKCSCISGHIALIYRTVKPLLNGRISLEGCFSHYLRSELVLKILAVWFCGLAHFLVIKYYMVWFNQNYILYSGPVFMKPILGCTFLHYVGNTLVVPSGVILQLWRNQLYLLLPGPLFSRSSIWVCCLSD